MTRLRRVPVSHLTWALVAACVYPVLLALESAARWKPLVTSTLVSWLALLAAVAWTVALFPLYSLLSVAMTSLVLAAARLRWPEVQVFLSRYIAPGWRAAWGLWRGAPGSLKPDEALWARALVVMLVALPLSWSVQRTAGPFWVISACACWLLYLWFNYMDATVAWMIMLFAAFVPLLALWRRALLSPRTERHHGSGGGAIATSVLAVTMGILALTTALVLPENVPPFQLDALARHVEQVFPVVAEWRGGGVGSRYTLGEAGFGTSVKDLGGQIQRRTDLVAEVEVSPDAGGRLYLRSEVWATYTGRGWENKHRRLKISSLGVVDLAVLLPREATWAYPRRDASNVTVLSVRPSSAQDSLLVLTEPFEIRQTARDVWGDAGGSLSVSARSREPYSVLSVVTQRPDSGSRGLALRWRQSGSGQVVPYEYLYVPESVPQRVREETMKVVRGAAGPWEAATRLERYIREYSYVEDAPRAPRGRDFVEYFLFDLQKGYCAYHSTALAVMCRIAGIPSRWVTGYLSPAGTGIREVQQQHAHAWVEVYMPGSGWVTLEGTPAYGVPAREQRVATSTPGESSGEQTSSGTRPPDAGLEEMQPPSGGAGPAHQGGNPAVLVSGAVLFMLLVRSGWTGYVWRRRYRRSATAAGLFEISLRLLSALGLGKAHDETAREYLKWLEKRAPEAGSALSGLAHLFEEEYYGGSRVAMGDWQKQETWLRLLRAVQASVGRARYLSRAYIWPGTSGRSIPGHREGGRGLAEGLQAAAEPGLRDD
jgi:transglutaminase-like putative cysteine protease